MDRLSALTAIVVVAFGAACDKGTDKTEPPPSRTNGAKVTSGQKASTDAFCDFHKADDSGPLLQFPALGEVKPAIAKGRWLWLNVWATWCKPCVEEMPRIVKWASDGKTFEGVMFDTAFVSVDENDADVAAFKKDHPDMPPTSRLADPKSQPEWFKQLGLDANPPIPIHVFVSPAGHVRCARAGSVRETDADAIRLLFKE
jgi:thiol-disulfide isomerase/thioredoxin